VNDKESALMSDLKIETIIEEKEDMTEAFEKYKGCVKTKLVDGGYMEAYKEI